MGRGIRRGTTIRLFLGNRAPSPFLYDGIGDARFEWRVVVVSGVVGVGVVNVESFVGEELQRAA